MGAEYIGSLQQRQWLYYRKKQIETYLDQALAKWLSRTKELKKQKGWKIGDEL